MVGLWTMLLYQRGELHYKAHGDFRPPLYMASYKIQTLLHYSINSLISNDCHIGSVALL